MLCLRFAATEQPILDPNSDPLTREMPCNIARATPVCIPSLNVSWENHSISDSQETWILVLPFSPSVRIRKPASLVLMVTLRMKKLKWP